MPNLSKHEIWAKNISLSFHVLTPSVSSLISMIVFVYHLCFNTLLPKQVGELIMREFLLILTYGAKINSR